MLTQEHIAAIEEAAQTFESLSESSRRDGFTGDEHFYQERADKLKEILQFVAEGSKTDSAPKSAPAGANATAPECSPRESDKAAAANAGALSADDPKFNDLLYFFGRAFAAGTHEQLVSAGNNIVAFINERFGSRTPAADAGVQKGGE
jgi:hypothetical protein